MHCSRHLAAAIFSVVSSDTALHEHQGLRYFAEKKQNFAGFSRANARKNRPISWDFCGGKVKIRGTIGRFRGILAQKSQFSKDFQVQILRKIGRFQGKFRVETSPRNNQ